MTRGGLQELHHEDVVRAAEYTPTQLLSNRPRYPQAWRSRILVYSHRARYCGAMADNIIPILAGVSLILVGLARLLEAAAVVILACRPDDRIRLEDDGVERKRHTRLRLVLRRR
jgi:hypothetical protein